MSAEMLKRAKHMACVLTDPTSKKDSFYCTIRRHVKNYSKEKGFELEIRKCTLSPWVEEYLMSVFVQELPIKEEKALIGTLRIVNYIMEHKVPDFVANIMARNENCSESSSTSRPFFITRGKVPKRGGFGDY